MIDVAFIAFGFACIVWTITNAVMGLQVLRAQFVDTELEGEE